MTENKSLRLLADLVSILFHPVFILPLAAAWIIYAMPSVRLSADPRHINLLFLSILLTDAMFPLVVVLLLKALNMVQSIRLSNQRDRIIPYIATMTFYFWSWRVMKFLPYAPASLVALHFGAFLAVSMALVLNSFMKISMHAAGVGGLLAFVVAVTFTNDISFIPLAAAALICGLVLTARQLASDHTNRELALGIAVGVVGQAIGFWIFA